MAKKIKQAIEFAGNIYREEDLVEVEYNMLNESCGLDKTKYTIRGRLCEIRNDAFTIDHSKQYHAGSSRIFFDMVNYIGPMKGCGAGE